MLQAKAYRNLSSFMTRSLAPHSLAVTEWAMLGLLRDSGSTRPTDLSEELGVSNPLTSRHIKRLGDLGWISRIEHEDDARGVLIALTPEGTAMVDKVESELRHEMRLYMKGISLRQLAAYLSVLEQLSKRSL
jgi:DNA-binding MarR family transcriptional regulator